MNNKNHQTFLFETTTTAAKYILFCLVLCICNYLLTSPVFGDTHTQSKFVSWLEFIYSLLLAIYLVLLFCWSLKYKTKQTNNRDQHAFHYFCVRMSQLCNTINFFFLYFSCYLILVFKKKKVY